MEIFCFLIGILFAYTHSFYLLLALCSLFFITPKHTLLLLFIMGVFIALIHEYWVSPKGFPDLAFIQQAQLTGSIVSIPQQSRNKTQFTFAVEQINGKPVQGLVQLSWYTKAPVLHAGQIWQLNTKIKHPRNFANPGSSDYVGTLHTRHIDWTGYVRTTNNQLIAEQQPHFNWLTLRERLAKNLTALAPNQQTAGVNEALTLNLTTHISQEDWDLFRRTGTTHLFGISGEHIALVSGLTYVLIRWLWSLSTRCCLMAPAGAVGAIGGLLLSLLYAFLAGFAPPVQRALLGCFFYTLYCLGKKKYTPWQVWRYALFAVLCLEPHAVFMQGFYFSFMAVLCLLLTQKRWPFKGYKQTLALQLSCLIGLMPLTLHWFSYGSLNGFIANLFAIPLVGFLIVPLALFTMVCASFSWSSWLMYLLSSLISLLFKGLIWTEQLDSINITASIHSVFLVFCATAALLVYVLLPVKPFQYFALLWLFCPLFPPRVVVPQGEVWMQVLDVGQGLAIVLRTKDHVLLYDTGDSFFQGSDMGAMVILPFLKYMGIKQIDKIIISHPDKDHRGGLKSVQKGIRVDQLLVNDPHYYHHALNCHHYGSWKWNGVSFRFLPIHDFFKDKNNTSCVLQIDNDHGRILLVGDIEKSAEDYLVRTYGNQLASEVLIVPHHGSKTSSSYRFLLEVAPRYAIASLGFDNRFHFPHEKTLASMKALGIPFYRTDACGMVEVKLTQKGLIKKPECYLN